MSYCPVSLTRFLAFFYLLNRKHCMPWRKAWIQGTVGYAINAAKEGKAPGRCGIPAEIWKHTWRYETRLLDFIRREKFCSKAWFKEEHKTANFPRAQGTFYLTSSSSLRRDITWSLQGAPDPQLISSGLWLVSDVQWTQSCYWVDKLLAPYTHLHNASLPILMRKNYHRPIGEFLSTTNTTFLIFRY